MQDNTYLFPFECVERGSRILIYGAGLVGQEYLRQLLVTNYCEPLAFLDRAFQTRRQLVIPIYAPQHITILDFDYVVLAFNNPQYAADAKETLERSGVDREKIVYVGQRTTNVSLEIDGDVREQEKYVFAFQRQNLAIALKFPSSLGDAIQRKALLLEMIKVFPGVLIDIYVTDSKFIKSLYCDVKELNDVIEDGGSLYYENKKKYLVALEVRFVLLIDNLNFRLASNMGKRYENLLRTLQADTEEYALSLVPMTQNRIQCERALYNGWNVYQFYNYISFLNVLSSKVYIPLDLSFENDWCELGLKNYITICHGNSSTSRGNTDTNSRSWSKEYWMKFVRMVKNKYPKLSIVQCGDDNAGKIDGVDRYILGCDIELTKYVLKNSLLYIGTEGGLVHLATQLGVKCICLFGPTQVQLFGYEQNINICTNVCSPCYYLYNKPFVCAKGQKKQECMYSITPQMVVTEVKRYMEHEV